jgi:hypothetical protein
MFDIIGAAFNFDCKMRYAEIDIGVRPIPAPDVFATPVKTFDVDCIPADIQLKVRIWALFIHSFSVENTPHPQNSLKWSEFRQCISP